MASTKRRLKKLIITHKPLLLFLSETLCPGNYISLFLSSVGFSSSFAVEPEGRKGGLVLAWNSALSADIVEACPFWIHTMVYDL